MNLFGDEGGRMVLEGVMKNNNLQYLNLSHNDLSSGSADVVCKVLETCKERNSKLRNLIMCGNSFIKSDLQRMDVSGRSEELNIIDTRGNDERIKNANLSVEIDS
jgi:Leucine-rich repeat (LRR) protein